jgi:MFS family permease
MTARFPTLPTALIPLAVPRLRRLLAAQVPADLADWLDLVALGTLLAFHWQLGPTALAGLTLAITLPYVILGPLIGVLIDRSDLRLLLIASCGLRAVATAAFVVAPDLPILLVLVALKSTVDALFTPAKQATIPLLAPADRLMAANGLSHTINQVTKVAGPALGGVLVAVLEPKQVFLVNAGLSVIAALVLFGLPRGLRPPTVDSPRRGFLGEFMEGLTHIRNRPLLATAIVAMAIGFMVTFLYDGLIALLVKEIGYSSSMFGVAIAALGAGGVFGALLLGQFGERRDPLLLMAAGGMVGGLLVALIGHVGGGHITMSPLLFLVTLFAIGIASAGLFVPYRTVLQRETPPNLLGRVTAVGEAAIAIATLVGPPLGAILANTAGISAPFLLGGYLIALLALALVFSQRRISAAKRVENPESSE